MKVWSYMPNVFDTPVDMVDRFITWEQRETARAEAYYADQLWPYTYGKEPGVRTYLPKLFDQGSLLYTIRCAVEEYSGESYEMLFCNRYEGPRNHLGWHADDSPQIDHDRAIAVVSYGAEREIWVRENGKGDTTEKIKLEHGSLFVMHPGAQLTHQHRIPKAGYDCGLRVSLTFRGYKENP